MKKTFSDDIPVEPIPESKQIEQVDLDSSSDDEAPEEEAVSEASALAQEKELAKLEQQKRQLEKQKRKQQNDLFAQQQKEKKQKQTKPLQELPEELLAQFEKTPVEKKSEKGTHQVFEDEEEEEEEEFIKRTKSQKLEMLRRIRKESVKKGPVHVKVLGRRHNTLAPPMDKTVMNKRDKWLKRKSLGKR